MKLNGQRSYPKSLIVNDNEWAIKFVNLIDKKETLGLCDPETKTVYIKKGQKRGEILSTALHEIFHVLEYEYGFDIKHSLVYKMEEAMTSFLLENLESLSAIFSSEKSS
jgi:hypothetical protein